MSDELILKQNQFSVTEKLAFRHSNMQLLLRVIVFEESKFFIIKKYGWFSQVIRLALVFYSL
jgi:hypothetical protein